MESVLTFGGYDDNLIEEPVRYHRYDIILYTESSINTIG